MEKPRHARIVPTTKLNVSLPSSRKREIRLKGQSVLLVVGFILRFLTKPTSAKYIEGLENRLGRMESLLKLSGLLPDGDDKTDLGDLERRLQESAGSSQNARSVVGRSSSESTCGGTPNTLASQSISNSPKNVRAPGAEEDVEALSDQLCSLVTNNCGETRFIGNALELTDLPKTWPRVRTRLCRLGSSSGFSIFSPKGIEWVNEKTGD